MTLPVPRVVVVREPTVDVIAREPGLPGPPGPQGPPGAAGGSRYEHVQGSPSTLWTVTHNLGYIPGSVAVYIGDDLSTDGVEIDLDPVQPTMILYVAVNVAQAGRVTVS